MKLGIALSLGFLFITITTIFAQIPGDVNRRFDLAERQIVRLPPSAFPDLPAAVARGLRKRNCTIPQESFAAKKRSNVIRGEFARRGQTDWAILCSVNKVSSILVFWNGSEKNPAVIAPMEDRNFLQGGVGEQIVFSREIVAAGRSFIMTHYNAYGGPVPPPLDHEGIDDAFLGKASITHYYYDRTWLTLTGAD